MSQLKVIQEETDEAIQRGIDNAAFAWRIAALKVVRKVASKKATFTANDCRELISKTGFVTHDNRAMGGVMHKAVSMGWIEATGSTIVSRVGHKSLLQVWRSKIYKKDETDSR